MIDARDLRTGNWYKQLALGKYAQVDLFLFHEMCDHELNDDASLNDYMQPIPLTPEILEACGLTIDWWGHNGDKPVGSYYLAGGYVSVTDEMKVWSNHEELEHIKYLHQLQNLVYSISGKELPIDITKLKAETPSKP